MRESNATLMRLVREGGVECCKHRPVVHRYIEDTTVGQLQPSAYPEFGEPKRLVAVRGRKHDAGGMEIVSHRRALPYPHAADEYLGQRHGVHKHPPRCAAEQDCSRRLVMWIGSVQMGDDDTRVKRDHSGQSPRKSVR